MEIVVKYFGIIADIAQKQEEVFIVEDTLKTLKSLQSKIEIKYPKILDVNYSVVINKKITNCDVGLKHQDLVALLPPFAGG